MFSDRVHTPHQTRTYENENNNKLDWKVPSMQQLDKMGNSCRRNEQQMRTHCHTYERGMHKMQL